MQYSQIYDGSIYGVNIDNNDLTFKLRCVPQVDEVYSPHFSDWGGTKVGMDWIFAKNNTLAIANVNKIVPGLNLKSLFTPLVTSPPKLMPPLIKTTLSSPSKPSLAPPKSTLMPPASSVNNISLIDTVLSTTNFTEDMQTLINKSISTSTISKPVEFGCYPRLIEFDNKNNINTHATIVDYSAASIALFARMDFLNDFCSQHYGNDDSKTFIPMSLGGLFNFKLKADPSGAKTSPGYIFAKNPPFEPYNKKDPSYEQKLAEYNIKLENYNRMKEFLIKLTGEDVFLKATRPPEKKSWGGNSWGAKKDYNANTGAIPGEFFTNGPSLTGVNISMESGPLPSSIPSGNALSSPFEQKKTPADLLNDLITMLTLPLITVQTKKLSDPNGWEKVGIYGPKNEVETDIEKWKQEGRDRGFEIDEVISITKNGNNITILIRVPLN